MGGQFVAGCHQFALVAYRAAFGKRCLLQHVRGKGTLVEDPLVPITRFPIVPNEAIQTAIQVQGFTERAGGRIRRKRVRQPSPYWKLGAMSGPTDVFVLAPTRENAVAGLFTRVFLHKKNGQWSPVQAPTLDHVFSCLKEVKTALLNCRHSFTPDPIMEYPKRWYTGWKLQRYMIAAANLLKYGFRRVYATTKDFPKVEKWKNELGKICYYIRIVRPRWFEFLVAVGRFIRQLEPFFCQRFGIILGGHRPYKVVMKGMNAKEQGENLVLAAARLGPGWICQPFDAQRWDQHVTRPLLSWEHQLYLACFHHSDRAELRALLEYQLKTKSSMITDTTVMRYTTEGTRCSGDVNTGMGNCILMVSIVTAYMWENKAPVSDFSILNNGDDCLLFVKPHLAHLLPGIVPWFSALGFVMKLEKPVTVLEDIEFCQTKPVFDGEKWRMVRSYPTSASKDQTFEVDVSNPSTYMKMLKAIGDCGMQLCSGIPVLQSYYKAYQRYGGGGPIWHPTMASGLFYLRGNLPDSDLKPITMAARLSFERAFHIPISSQLALEKYYDMVDLSWSGVDEFGSSAPVHFF